MFSTIVVGTDGSRTAYRAVQGATQLARLCSARLHLVTAYLPSADMAVVGPMGAGLAPEEHQVPADIVAMLDVLDKEISAGGVDVTVHAIAARAADAILDVADQHQADAIVLGNRGVQGTRPYVGGSP
jgi:nucleotide-binding universal stress UspA family protein